MVVLQLFPGHSGSEPVGPNPLCSLPLPTDVAVVVYLKLWDGWGDVNERVVPGGW